MSEWSSSRPTPEPEPYVRPGSCAECTGNDVYGCIDGDYYGPCASELCGGLCDYEGKCDCACHGSSLT